MVPLQINDDLTGFDFVVFRRVNIQISYLRDRVCSIYSGAGKFCLAHRLRQLKRDTKSDVSCLQTMLTPHNENFQMTIGVSRHITFKEKQTSQSR